MEGKNSANYSYRKSTPNSLPILTRLLETGISTKDSRLKASMKQRIDSRFVPRTSSFQQNSVEINRTKSLVIPPEQCFDIDYSRYEPRPTEVERKTPSIQPISVEVNRPRPSVIPPEQCFDVNYIEYETRPLQVQQRAQRTSGPNRLMHKPIFKNKQKHIGKRKTVKRELISKKITNSEPRMRRSQPEKQQSATRKSLIFFPEQCFEENETTFMEDFPMDAFQTIDASLPRVPLTPHGISFNVPKEQSNEVLALKPPTRPSGLSLENPSLQIIRASTASTQVDVSASAAMVTQPQMTRTCTSFSSSQQAPQSTVAPIPPAKFQVQRILEQNRGTPKNRMLLIPPNQPRKRLSNTPKEQSNEVLVLKPSRTTDLSIEKSSLQTIQASTASTKLYVSAPAAPVFSTAETNSELPPDDCFDMETMEPIVLSSKPNPFATSQQSQSIDNTTSQEPEVEQLISMESQPELDHTPLACNLSKDQSNEVHDLQTSGPSDLLLEQHSTPTIQVSNASTQDDVTAPAAPVIDTPIIVSELPSEEVFDMNRFRMEVIALLSKPSPFAINTSPVPSIERSQKSHSINNTVSEVPKEKQMLSNALQIDSMFQSDSTQSTASVMSSVQSVKITQTQMTRSSTSSSSSRQAPHSTVAPIPPAESRVQRISEQSRGASENRMLSIPPNQLHKSSSNMSVEQSTKVHDVQPSGNSDLSVERLSVQAIQTSTASAQDDVTAPAAPAIDVSIIESELRSEEVFDMESFRREAIALLSKPDPFAINTSPVPFIEQSKKSHSTNNRISKAPKKKEMLSNAPQMNPMFQSDTTVSRGQEEEQVTSAKVQPELNSIKLKESSKYNMQLAESHHIENQQPETTPSSVVTPSSSVRDSSSIVASTSDFSTSSSTISSVPVASSSPLSRSIPDGPKSLPTSNLTPPLPPVSANRDVSLNEPFIAMENGHLSSQQQKINRKRKTKVQCTGVPSVRKSGASSSKKIKRRTMEEFSEDPDIIFIGTTTQSTPSAFSTAPTFSHPVRQIAPPCQTPQINRKRKTDSSSLMTGRKQTRNTRVILDSIPEEFEVINPIDDEFDVVNGRLAMGHYQPKYIITREEVRRRLSGPEKLNSTSLLCNLKRAQVPNKQELVGNLLNDKGLNVPMNNCKSVVTTKVTSLTEAEAVNLGRDLRDVVAKFYPADKISKEVAMEALEMNKDCQEAMMDNGKFLDCMSALNDAFTSVVPPITGIKPSPSLNKKLNDGVENLSCVTHGLGIVSHRVWLRQIAKIGEGIPLMMRTNSEESSNS